MALKKYNICMSCHEDFPDKESYWVPRNNNTYRVIYCMECIMEKGITEYECLSKPRKKKEK